MFKKIVLVSHANPDKLYTSDEEGDTVKDSSAYSARKRGNLRAIERGRKIDD